MTQPIKRIERKKRILGQCCTMQEEMMDSCPLVNRRWYTPAGISLTSKLVMLERTDRLRTTAPVMEIMSSIPFTSVCEKVTWNLSAAGLGATAMYTASRPARLFSAVPCSPLPALHHPVWNNTNRAGCGRPKHCIGTAHDRSVVQANSMRRW